jgi:hypothetical protein
MLPSNHKGDYEWKSKSFKYVKKYVYGRRVAENLKDKPALTKGDIIG